jgi:hypothetical protein
MHFGVNPAANAFFRREINCFTLISVNFEQNLRLQIEVIVVIAHALTSCKHHHVALGKHLQIGA